MSSLQGDSKCAFAVWGRKHISHDLISQWFLVFVLFQWAISRVVICWEYPNDGRQKGPMLLSVSPFVHNNMHFCECSLWGRRMPQDVSSIYLWSCISAFSAIEPSVAVSQGKLTSLLIALLVITECSWSSAVSSLRDILRPRLSFPLAARSSSTEDQQNTVKWPQTICVTKRKV